MPWDGRAHGCEPTRAFSAGLNLPYPTGTIIGEMILLTVICIIDANRIFLGSIMASTQLPAGLTSCRCRPCQRPHPHPRRTLAASRGNKTEKTPPMAWSLLLCLFAFGGYLYMAIGQVYV